MLERLIMHWVYGGALAGILLLIMFPLLISSWSAPLALTFLHLPMYMLHQYEEHDKDRFRIFFNETIGGGKEVLSPLAVFMINVPGVWGVIAIATYLAAKVNIGLGLIAVYLAVINGLVHIGHALLFKRYNPGLVTGVTLFLPIGAYSIWQFQLSGNGGFAAQAIGIVVAVGIHVAIIAYVRAKGVFLSKALNAASQKKSG
jgi:hypothetical protein